MKKNTMLRIASVLMIAVMITTCAVSGTFAKYVTSQTGTDSARVAKFGVTITANGSTFAQEYATDNVDVKATIAKSVVTSGDMKNLVAPGTKGDMVAMTISGIPEVAVNVKYVATLTISNNWVDSTSNEYFPVYFVVNGSTYGTDDTSLTLDHEYETVAELKTAVEAAINAYSANYAPHTDLSVESAVSTPDVSWVWAFENGQDVKDTYLGDQAAAGEQITIDLTVVTTVTQID